MNFLIYDEKLLEAYNAIWDKICNLSDKGFHSEPVYDNEYLKIEMKSYNGKNARRKCAQCLRFYNIIRFCC